MWRVTASFLSGITGWWVVVTYTDARHIRQQLSLQVNTVLGVGREFEVSLRFPNGDIRQAPEYVSLEIGEQVSFREGNVYMIILQIVISLDGIAESAQGENVG